MKDESSIRVRAAALGAILLIAVAGCATTGEVNSSRVAAEEAIRSARAVGADQWVHTDMVLAEESHRIGNYPLAKERADTAREKTLALKGMPAVTARITTIETTASTALATAQRAEAKADRAEANSLSALEQARQAELRAKETEETRETKETTERSTSAFAPSSSVAQAPVPGGAQGSPLRDVFFDYDSSAVRAEARDTLMTNAQWLKANSDVAVTIEGHCDERGSSEYNLALGMRRAKAAQDVLVASGITPERISVVSYGKERPFAEGHDESAWRWNRRAHFVAGSPPGPRVSSAR